MQKQRQQAEQKQQQIAWQKREQTGPLECRCGRIGMRGQCELCRVEIPFSPSCPQRNTAGHRRETLAVHAEGDAEVDIAAAARTHALQVTNEADVASSFVRQH